MQTKSKRNSNEDTGTLLIVLNLKLIYYLIKILDNCYWGVIDAIL